MTVKRSAPEELRVFFQLAFVASWGVGGVGVLIDRAIPGANALSTTSPLYYLAAYAISLVGILLTAYYAGLSGVRSLARRLVPRRTDAWAYLSVLTIYVAIAGVATATARGVGFAMHVAWSSVFLQLPSAALRDPGPIGEEFGWRGFALPRLVDRYSPLHAAVLLGLVHTVWHVPLFFIGSMPQAQVFFPTFAIGVVAIAVIDTFLYMHTQGNVVLAILVHALANLCGEIAKGAGALNAFFILEGVVAGALVASGAFVGRRSGDAASVAPTG